MKYVLAARNMIHDCYIVEYDDSTNRCNLLRSEVVCENVPGLQYFPDMQEKTIQPVSPNPSSYGAPNESIIDG